MGGGTGHHRLAVLAGQAQTDLLVHPEATDRIDLEGLPPEVALPVLEDERLPRPAALGVTDEAGAEVREAGTVGGTILQHR